MPTADGKPIFEDLVALLQTKPSPFALAGHIDLITGALVDLGNRVKNLEHASLVAQAGDQRLVDTSAAYETRIAALEGNDKDYKTRITKVETAPAADSKRLDDLEKRVRTVEGAVGSTGFKDAKAAPAAAPFKGPDATAPIADPKPATDPKPTPATGTIFGGA
jgi:hypothetical protein